MQPALAACPLDLGRVRGGWCFSGDHMIAFQAERGGIEVGEAFALLGECLHAK